MMILTVSNKLFQVQKKFRIRTEMKFKSLYGIWETCVWSKTGFFNIQHPNLELFKVDERFKIHNLVLVISYLNEAWKTIVDQSWRPTFLTELKFVLCFLIFDFPNILPSKNCNKMGKGWGFCPVFTSHWI